MADMQKLDKQNQLKLGDRGWFTLAYSDYVPELGMITEAVESTARCGTSSPRLVLRDIFGRYYNIDKIYEWLPLENPRA